MSKNAQRNFNWFLNFIGLLFLSFIIYIVYRISSSDKQLIPISVIAIIAGVIFEGKRLSDDWPTVLLTSLASFIFSFIAFIPGKRVFDYDIESRIENFPYWFIFIFALISIAFHERKAIPKLTEGVTLLQSLSLLYWIFDYGLSNYHNWFVITMLTIATLLSSFSILNALTYFHLSRKARLILSVWSSIIMFAFAVDNIIRVYSNPEIESSKYLSDGIYIGLQYFLLGVSTVYIMQNFILLAAFLPNEDRDYKQDLKENIKEHIRRYSDEQVSVRHSLLCILYVIIVYGLNYKYQILPRHTIIWLVFMTFPIILRLITKINERKNYS